jgi:hypothetical protein
VERLTKRINGYAHGAEGVTEEELTGNYCRGEFEATACVEKLAEYEDLEEQGLLLRLPFKLPSVIWCAKKGEPTHKSFYDVPSQVISDMEYGYVFGFTKEEAEQALAKMKEV